MSKASTYIVVMDNGVAYDGVYAYKQDAECLCEFLSNAHRDHKFSVQETPESFSMRQRERIHDWFKQQ